MTIDELFKQFKKNDPYYDATISDLKDLLWSRFNRGESYMDARRDIVNESGITDADQRKVLRLYLDKAALEINNSKETVKDISRDEVRIMSEGEKSTYPIPNKVYN